MAATRRWATTIRWTLALCGLVAAGLLFGFFVFASSVTGERNPAAQRADGIVVLTGGEFRIREAGKLLRDGHAQRLLITGVNRQTPNEDIRRLTGLSEKTFECCVDLGYEALNTQGNANETGEWVRRRSYSSIIVVTSSYHMPRSLAELSRTLPDTQLLPHAVVPKALRKQIWWLDARASRLLASEYVKFLPAAAKLLIVRLIGDWTTDSMADSGEAKSRPAS